MGRRLIAVAERLDGKRVMATVQRPGGGWGGGGGGLIQLVRGMTEPKPLPRCLLPRRPAGRRGGSRVPGSLRHTDQCSAGLIVLRHRLRQGELSALDGAFRRETAGGRWCCITHKRAAGRRLPRPRVIILHPVCSSCCMDSKRQRPTAASVPEQEDVPWTRPSGHAMVRLRRRARLPPPPGVTASFQPPHRFRHAGSLNWRQPQDPAGCWGTPRTRMTEHYVHMAGATGP